MVRTILIAVDSSNRAEEVLATGAEIARLCKARICLLRVVPIPTDIGLTSGRVPSEPTSLLADLVMEELLSLVENVPSVDSPQLVVRRGQPWRSILELGDEIDADLIVIGAHGFHSDPTLGSTAAKVANHARRSVLVVHPRDGARSSPRVT
jgi:nucleotide-binding universal stress UspA family protein